MRGSRLCFAGAALVVGGFTMPTAAFGQAAARPVPPSASSAVAPSLEAFKAVLGPIVIIGYDTLGSVDKGYVTMEVRETRGLIGAVVRVFSLRCLSHSVLSRPALRRSSSRPMRCPI